MPVLPVYMRRLELTVNSMYPELCMQNNVYEKDRLNKAPSSTASDLECRLSSRRELSMGLQVNLVYSQHLSTLGTLQRTVVAPVLSLVLVCGVLLFCHQSVLSFQ
jgi:hypothetical protein